MLVAHVSDGAYRRDRAAEQEGVGDARHRGFPLPDGRGLAFSHAGARVQEHQRPTSDVGFDDRRGERTFLREEQRRAGLRGADDVPGVVDQVEALAQVAGHGLERRQAVDHAHDVSRALERVADLVDLMAHEGQVAARIGADDEHARPWPHAGRRAATGHRPVEYEPLAEGVAQAPELLLVVQELPRHAVQRRADEERAARDLAQLFAQPRRDQRAVEDLATGLGLLGEPGARGAAQQCLRALQQVLQRDVVERLAELLENGLVEVSFRNVETVAERPLCPLDRERGDESHRRRHRSRRTAANGALSVGTAVASP